MVLLLILLALFLQRKSALVSSEWYPQINVGDVPPNGKPYQIVRVIEYIVPFPYKISMGKNARAPSATTTATDSMEVIPARIENFLAMEQTTTSTAKPKATRHFLLKVLHGNTIICSGALISCRLVLTSAHCFVDGPTDGQKHKPLAQEYKVQASRTRIYDVANIILGPEASIAEDMALTVLKVSVQDAYVQPVALCDTQLQRPDNVTMYMSQRHLRFLRTEVITNGACKRSYALDESVFITATMLCARNSNKVADCQTTKGDLLLHQDTLCGINIYGSHCSEGSINGDLYADVFKARKHLKRLIKAYG
ncbi:hypothetical protein KR067_012276 [Drosophila pandora]|nr:hypothetical protein KR067_012276 [Drosophila pandora]